MQTHGLTNISTCDKHVLASPTKLSSCDREESDPNSAAFFSFQPPDLPI